MKGPTRIAFYCSKRGCGRTVAMYNVADQLTKRSKKVMVVDLDFDDVEVGATEATSEATYVSSCVSFRAVSTTTNAAGVERTPILAGVAGIIMHFETRSVLLPKRFDDHPVFKGVWTLPGGGIEPSDLSLTAALSREIWEEAYIIIPEYEWKLRDARLVVAGGQRVLMTFFMVVAQNLWDAVNLEPDKHERWAWHAPESIDEIPIREHELEIIRAASNSLDDLLAPDCYV